MSTITSKSIIDELIANDGYYPDDPQVALIVEYTNAYGEICWGVTWTTEPKERRERYLVESFYVHKPKVLWRADKQGE